MTQTPDRNQPFLTALGKSLEANQFQLQGLNGLYDHNTQAIENIIALIALNRQMQALLLELSLNV